MDGKQSYYGVKVGRVPGVYRTWKEVQEQTVGYSKAIFKKFSTLEEALGFVTVSPPPSLSSSEELVTAKPLTIFCDGSFSNGKMGYATICVETEEEYYGPVYGDKASNNVAELYAILSSLVRFGERGIPLVIYTDSMLCISLLRDGYTAHTNKELVAHIRGVLHGKNVTFVHVPGHTGNVYNEWADTLANRGRMM